MNHEVSVIHQISFLAIQTGIILLAARFCGKAAQKFHIPPVLGELLAGIIIGPYLLGSLNLGLLGFDSGIFPLPHDSSLPVSTSLYGIATLGSIILLFMSGLETDLRLLFRYSVAGTVVGLGGVIFSFGFGAGLCMVMLDVGIMDPRALFLGILSTATSVGITARILSEKKSIDSPEGTTILAAAVIDDVLGIICLAVVMGLLGVAGSDQGSVNWARIGMISLKSIGIWLGITALGLFFAHRIAKFLKFFRPSAQYSVMAFGLALLLAGFFEQAGLAMIVGAYVMGLSLSKTDIAFSLQRTLHGVYDFLVPVFFVVMGMLVDVRVLGDWEVLKFGLIYSILAVLAKIIGCGLPACFMNFNLLGSCRIGAGMIPRGEVALIIAGIGATSMMTVNNVRIPVINAQLFGVTIIMTLLTTVIAPPLLSFLLSIKRKGVKKEIGDLSLVHTCFRMPSEFVRDFIFRALVDNLRLDGFRHSEIDREAGIINFRKESMTFTLNINGNDFDFESNLDEVMLIKTAMYETFVELHKNLSELKKMASPVGMEEAILNGSAIKTSQEVLNLPHIIPHNCVATSLKAKNSEDAIRELIRLLEQNGRLLDAETCIRDVLAREAVISTCIADGIALPHTRTTGVRELVAAIGISPEGCLHSDGSGAKIRIFVLSLCPKFAEEPYLQFVAHIAAVLSDENNLRILSGKADSAQIHQLFSTRK
ncbi:MAG: PTS transporter subunit EIIA [Oligosphaeraceae bacterium]|nr:PTS transporter subunit EIIA [Oligosphaeraceae bacterium]